MTGFRFTALLAVGAATIVVTLGVLGVSARRLTASPAPRSVERSLGFFDPHLHLSIREVRVVDTLDGGVVRAGAGKRLWIVTVRGRNDAARIDIDPWGLDVAVRSSDGRAFAPLDLVGSVADVSLQTRLDGTLHPGDSIDWNLLFELPEDAVSPLLVVEANGGPLAWLPRGLLRVLGARVELGLS